VSKSAAKNEPVQHSRSVGRPKVSEGNTYPMPAKSGGRALIDLKETAKRVGCHPLTIYRHLKNISDFPRPIRISPNRIAFFEDEIIDYIDSRPRA
jgi:prophage regulatory protein